MPRQPTYATLAVLEALLDAPGEVPDYEIANGVRGVGPRRVYRVLKRLERDGWLHSRWEEGYREHRKYIRLTGLGTLSGLHLLGGKADLSAGDAYLSAGDAYLSAGEADLSAGEAVDAPPPAPQPGSGIEQRHRPQSGPSRFFDQDA